MGGLPLRLCIKRIMSAHDMTRRSNAQLSMVGSEAAFRVREILLEDSAFSHLAPRESQACSGLQERDRAGPQLQGSGCGELPTAVAFLTVATAPYNALSLQVAPSQWLARPHHPGQPNSSFTAEPLRSWDQVNRSASAVGCQHGGMKGTRAKRTRVG